MNKSLKAIIKFNLQLALLLVVFFVIQLLFYNKFEVTITTKLLLITYVLNYLLAVGIFISLYLSRVKYKDLLGFIFMFGSFLKFLIYFVLLHPMFKKDGVISNQEAITFLVPYLLCLVFETTYVSKVLNNKI